MATVKKQPAQTVRMVRNPDEYPAPHSADVHVDEVAAWQRHGWIVEPKENGAD